MKIPARTLLAIGGFAAVCLLWFLLHRPSPPLPPKPQTAAKPPAVKKRHIVAAKAEQPLMPQVPDLTPAQQRTVDEWMQHNSDWRSLNSLEAFNEMHMSAFQSLRRDEGWKHRLKQAASLARIAQGEAAATPENTAVVFNFDKIFANENDRRLYASALVAGDRKAIEDIYISRMWAIATEQHFNSNATESGGLNPIQMTDELREQLRREFAKDKEGR